MDPGTDLGCPLEAQYILLATEYHSRTELTLKQYFYFYIEGVGGELMCMSAQACRIQKRMLDPLEMWVAGAELRSLERSVCSFLSSHGHLPDLIFI